MELILNNIKETSSGIKELAEKVNSDKITKKQYKKYCDNVEVLLTEAVEKA